MLRSVLLSLGLLTALFSFGQSLPDMSLSGFVPCDGADVMDSDTLLIGAFDLQGRFFFMSSEAASSNRLAATIGKDGEPLPVASIMWKLVSGERGVRILTPDGKQGLSAGTKGNTSLLLQSSTNTSLWTLNLLEDGSITLNGKSDASRYLGLSGYEKEAFFGYYTEGGADDIRLHLYRRGTKDPVPAEAKLTEGVLTLSGDWTAEQLAGISWDGVGALDLTNIRIPADAKPFTNLPDDRNIPIYVSENVRNRVPESWHFVVCGEHLLTEQTLVDCQPLVLPYPFHVGDSQMCYAREWKEDGGWETLSLPFDADIPSGFEAYRLLEVGDGELLFVPTETIWRNEPVIVRLRPEAAPSSQLQIFSKDGIVSTEEPQGQKMHGTLQLFEVHEAAAGVYMLDAAGTGFVRALEGSTLQPFRAYLRLQGSSASRWRISLPASGIRLPAADGADDGMAFDLCGRRLRSGSQAGMRIEGGRKVLYE